MDGDVIIADTAEDNTVGKCAEIIGIADKAVVSGLHTIPCRPRSQFAQGYLGYFMNSPAFHDQLLPLMQGTKVTSVSKSAMADTLICYPPDVTEQALIGQHFMKLDNLITLHQRQGIRSAYYPFQTQRKNTFPWEQRKVGDFANVLSASRVHKNEWRPSGVPFYRSSDVVSAFKGNDNEKAFIDKELYEELVKSSGKLEQDDILITGGGSIGIPYIVPNNDPLYSKDADLIWIKKSSSHDSRYLYTYFISQGFREYISSISHVGTIAHYTIEQVKETPVLLPEIAEQRALGGFFAKIDSLITLHQREYIKRQTEVNNVKYNQRDGPVLRILRAVDWRL